MSAGKGEQLRLPDVEKLWTVEDLADYLDKPASWVYDNHAKLFPSYRIGQALRFDPAEIATVLRSTFRNQP